MERRIVNGMILGVVVLALVMAGEVAVARADSGDEARPSWEDRFFVNVSGGYQTATPNFSYMDNAVWFEEMATAEVDFEGSGSGTFEIGGGVRLLGNFGFGAAYTRYSGEQTASLTASIPDPIFWDSHAVGELSVPTKRTESVIHLQALYMIPVTRKLQVAVFGGPSWFDCEQEAISTFMVEGSGPWYDWTVELSDPENQDPRRNDLGLQRRGRRHLSIHGEHRGRRDGAVQRRFSGCRECSECRALRRESREDRKPGSGRYPGAWRNSDSVLERSWAR